MSLSNKVAIAIAAHPDDIEFQMAGTLMLLKQAGYETHYMNVSSGNCGSLEFDSKRTRVVRAGEGKQAAKILGAKFHPSLTDDLEIFYDLKMLRRLAAVIREVKPSIVLTHSPQDYMEDHMNTCRLAVTAAFTHGMPNFKTIPSRPIYNGDVTLYHCMPHGLRDGLRRRVWPGAYVNVASVQETKRNSLAAHKSQQGWLDASQGMNSYLLAMEEMSLELGKMSKKFKYAEGWRRHLHLGFAARDIDPLAEVLKSNYLINKAYEQALENLQ
ncbi:PIG-L deacetylase family protein [Pedosphaera parvula]|uniref:LmbE family protein n=1 Tax=Pedosphaera parvula (strain Ellin514) TaxID=320771 RepID=B9XLY7_PEDPL|nr:PIG-L family deacetylase [Pedosphaera parvula]EEF59115.1 LmbE family protein [Pedosphaera parvula Ellin514]